MAALGEERTLERGLLARETPPAQREEEARARGVYAEAAQITRAPAAANTRAVASPMPAEAPVMSATCPSVHTVMVDSPRPRYR